MLWGAALCGCRSWRLEWSCLDGGLIQLGYVELCVFEHRRNTFFNVFLSFLIFTLTCIFNGLIRNIGKMQKICSKNAYLSGFGGRANQFKDELETSLPHLSFFNSYSYFRKLSSYQKNWGGENKTANTHISSTYNH